jgi:hypothetical protein
VLSNTAAGGSDGIVAAGPSNKHDGATAAPGVNGNSDLNFAAIAPCDESDAPQRAGQHLFGNFSD